MALPSGWSSESGRFVSSLTHSNGMKYTVTTETNDKRCTFVTVTVALPSGNTDSGTTATYAQKQAVHEAMVTAVNAKINSGF